MTRAIAKLALAGLLIGGGSPARADEVEAPARVDKTIEIPAHGAEEIDVVNRLGSVDVEGWDQAAVRVTATKRAPDGEVAERLRVQVSSRDGRRIDVRTYARLRPALPPALSRELGQLMQRQSAVLARLMSRSTGRIEAREQLRQIQREVEALTRRFADVHEQAKPSDVAVPVAGGRLDLRLRVPRGLLVRARTFNGAVSVSRCEAGAELSSESGRVVVAGVKGDVKTWTQRGAQRVTGVRGRAEVRGGSADVVLRDISEAVRAFLLSGSIDARALGSRRALLSTISGSIRVDAPPQGSNYAVTSREGNLIIGVGKHVDVEGRAPAFDAEGAGVRLDRLVRDGERFSASAGRGAGHIQASTRRGTVKLVSSGQ